MSTRYSLAHLTLLDLSPTELVHAAAKTGYQFIGLRLLPASPGGRCYRLMDDPGTVRLMLALMADTDVDVFDLEIIRIGPDFRASDYLAFFEVGQRLSARAILVAGDDPDEGRLTANFAALCEAAAPFELSCDLEFMPWTKVPDASSALRIVSRADQKNGGVLVDALHYGRSSSTLADVAAIPRKWLHYAQICDGPAGTAPVDALIHTARCERLLPGEGGIDLVGLFATLPGDLPVSVELPSESRAPQFGPEEWARRTLAAAKATVAAAEARRAPA
ncbi:sugar phosphate isomerase/epimerase family protein [Phreatobacter stygius]|uniref:Sugar phosphate isomerase/epimerase n=1 Tax=Phreatobacter stygius TaxID=1940610 RepID=A0A4D7B8P6_9HYPH|nr:TIM barrel protein [Phreatobacter stygius]QCI65946.1 sugar phosphate isomerase/epimerase [Phreatobacter stygius]